MKINDTEGAMLVFSLLLGLIYLGVYVTDCISRFLAWLRDDSDQSSPGSDF